MTFKTFSRLVFDQRFRYLKSYRYRAIDPSRVARYHDSSATHNELVSQLEDKIGKRVKQDHVVVTGSGNNGLSGLFDYLIQNGKKHFVSQGYICKHTAAMVGRRHARLLLRDIRLDSFNIDYRVPDAKHVLIGVHAFGNMADGEEIAENCEKNGGIYIEDCAHALGARSNRVAGQSGWASVFSFRKNIYAGSGGAVATSDARLADLLRKKQSTRIDRAGADWTGKRAMALRPLLNEWGYPLYSRYEYNGSESLSGIPSRLSVSVALSQLDYLDKFIEQTITHAKKLHSLLCDFEGITLLPLRKNKETIYTRFLIGFDMPQHAQRFKTMAREAGYELGMDYGQDFLFNCRVAGVLPESLPNSFDASARWVPVGLQGVNPVYIAELAHMVAVSGDVGRV